MNRIAFWVGPPAKFAQLIAVCWIFIGGLLSGCQSIHYMGQAISGHLDLLNRREPVADLLEDPQTPEELRKQLLLSTELLAFAEKELLLPAGKQYRSYVNLDRPYVVWNVFAAPELSLEPRTWCYPVAGCTVYRGFFSETQANQYAQRLAGRGYDVMVGGVTAYSTLGWFSDPLLSTFIDRSESGLAMLIFHELAHQLIYVPDDSSFNESFATTVAQEGLRRWFLSRNNLDQYRRYREFSEDRQTMVSIITAFREQLQNLYQSPLPEDVKRRQKIVLFGELRQEFESRRNQKRTLAVFSDWFEPPLNNAKLVSIATYHDYVPAFRQLLANNQNDLDRFYQQCRRLAGYNPAKRRSALQDLVRVSQHRAVVMDF